MRRTLVLALPLLLPASAGARPGDLDRRLAGDGVIREVRAGGAPVPVALPRPSGGVDLVARSRRGVWVLGYAHDGRRQVLRPPVVTGDQHHTLGAARATEGGLRVAVSRYEGASAFVRLDSARRELSRIALDREVSPSAAVPLADGRWAIVASGGRESRLLRLAGDGTLEAPWPAMTVRDHLAPMAPLRGGGFAVLDVSHGAHPRLLRFSADGQAAAHPLPSGRNRGALTCDHHDRCVVVDTARSGQLLARRYGPDGRLDPAYGSRWPRTTAPADAQAAAFDSHGRLLVAAHAHPRAIVTRLDRRGRPDRTFGRNGHVVLRRPNGSWIDIPTGIAQTRRGIVVAGWSDNDANFREDYEPPRVLVARLRS